MAEPVTQNRYIYVHNNPLLYSDPTGLCRYGNEYEPWSECIAEALGMTGLWDNTVAAAQSPDYWRQQASIYGEVGGLTARYVPGGQAAGFTTVVFGLGFEAIANYLEPDVEQFVQERTVNYAFSTIPFSVPGSIALQTLGPPVTNYAIDSLQSSWASPDGGICPQP